MGDATWGPTWNAWVFGAPAPAEQQFNDPFAASFGPANPACGACSPDIGEREHNARGFGAAIGAQPLFGPLRDGATYIQIYVR